MKMTVTVVVESKTPGARRRVAAGRIGPGIATVIVVEDWYRDAIETDGVELPESRRTAC